MREKGKHLTLPDLQADADKPYASLHPIERNVRDEKADINASKAQSLARRAKGLITRNGYELRTLVAPVRKIQRTPFKWAADMLDRLSSAISAAYR